MNSRSYSEIVLGFLLVIWSATSQRTWNILKYVNYRLLSIIIRAKDEDTISKTHYSGGWNSSCCLLLLLLLLISVSVFNDLSQNSQNAHLSQKPVSRCVDNCCHRCSFDGWLLEMCCLFVFAQYFVHLFVFCFCLIVVLSEVCFLPFSIIYGLTMLNNKKNCPILFLEKKKQRSCCHFGNGFLVLESLLPSPGYIIDKKNSY